MRVTLPLRHNEGGFALEATLLVLLILSSLIVIAYAGLLTTIRTANIDYQNTRVFYASEGAAEVIMAQLEDNLRDGVLTDAELAGLTSPAVPGFTIDSFRVTKIGAPVQERITDGAYAGLYSLTQRLEIYTAARDALNNRSAVLVAVKAQSIPLFQFGVFFEKDLEATNGPPMTFGGWVHSNGNIYFSSANAWYKDVITTPNRVFHDRKDFHNVYNGVYIANASGVDVALDFDSRTAPNPGDFRAASNARFNNRLKTDAYQVDSLKVPLPPGMDPVEVIRPRNATDTDQMQESKFAWRADWYIEVVLDSIKGAGKNICPKMISTRTAGKVLPTIGACQKIFSMTWDAFFEGREKRFVDVFEVDIGELRNWVGTDATRRTDVLYVTFIGAPSTPANTDKKNDGWYPVVRLKNGSQLPNPLSVATGLPLYVQGDYNKNTWVPAALVGDAIYWLSNAWVDGSAEHQCSPKGYFPALLTLTTKCPDFKLATAVNTDIYAAVLAGHSPTPCDHEVAGCPGGYTDFYGGGIENFPRFLENWSGVTMLYRGSLVTLHWSTYPKGTWNGTYYSPPKRDWMFDTRFKDPANLPPGTPVVGSVIHTAFRPAY